MNTVSRRQAIKTSVAGGAAVAGGALAGLAIRGSGHASAATTTGVHIHGTVTFVGTTPSGGSSSMNGMGGMNGMSSMSRMATPEYHHVVNIDVRGSDSDLSGTGWGATTEASDLTQAGYPDGLQCIYSQRGSIVGDVVRLKGRMLFSGAPDQDYPRNHIVVEANLSNGHIRWIGDDFFVLEGTGVVMRV